MDRYRIRRGADKAWLTWDASPQPAYYFWTDNEDLAQKFFVKANAEHLLGRLMDTSEPYRIMPWRPSDRDALTRALVERVPR